jgi:hypothetical protein
MAKTTKTKEPKVYTYRADQKLMLEKHRDQFVVRRRPDELREGAEGEQVSSASTRITCDPAELETLMAQARASAVAHHAYGVADTGEEFLITDRVIVTFAEPKTPEELGAFAGQYALELVTKYTEAKYLFRLTTATGMNPVKLVVKLVEREAQVARAEHDLNMRFRIAQVELPTDPHRGPQGKGNPIPVGSRQPELSDRPSGRSVGTLYDRVGLPVRFLGVGGCP